MIMQKKLERRRRRRGESEERGVELGGREQMPPSEPAPMDKTPSPQHSPHPAAGGKFSPGKASPLSQRPVTGTENKEPRSSKDFIHKRSLANHNV